jgi:hypothetical protein
MNDLDTTLPADVAALRSAAAWCRDHLGPGLSSAADTLVHVRQDRAEWSGDAADAFRARMSSVLESADSATETTATAAGALDHFADVVAQALAALEGIRATAEGAGLTLTPGTIVRPTVPSPPQDPGAAATPADASRFQSASLAHERAQDRATAFATASTSVADLHTTLADATAELERAAVAVKTLSIPAIDFAVGAAIGARTGQGATALRGQAAFLADQADTIESRTRLAGASQFPHQFYGDLDDAARMRLQGQAAVDDAARLARLGKAGGVVTSTLLTGVSIHNDIEAGESTEQALASNLGGLGASVAAGAGVGMLLGSFAPGIGNVAGAIIGAGVGGVVGIFSSGVIDGLYENNGEILAAISTGAGDLWDTATAAGDLVVSSGKAIADTASSIGEGLSDAWDSVFG